MLILYDTLKILSAVAFGGGLRASNADSRHAAIANRSVEWLDVKYIKKLVNEEDIHSTNPTFLAS